MYIQNKASIFVWLITSPV